MHLPFAFTVIGNATTDHACFSPHLVECTAAHTVCYLTISSISCEERAARNVSMHKTLTVQAVLTF